VNQEALEFYATPGRFTTLDDGDFSSGDIRKVVEVVQGLLLYDVVAQPFYGVELGPDQAEAIHERDTARLLAVVRAVDARALDEARPPHNRVGARCHAFSRVTVAFLRAAGVPARARCGFGAYFRPGWFEDHWVARHGAHWIAGNLRLDLASLNKVEMLPWDVWGAGWEPGEQPTEGQLQFFDTVADLTVDPDARFDEVRRRYETDTSLRMDGKVLNVLHGRVETV
jgi:hypothetical protein